MPDPHRKSMDIIDPEAAVVVRRIFDLAAAGMKVGEIAQTLNDENIPTPAVHYQRKHPESKRYRNLSEQKCWDYAAVLNILKRYTYTGASVGHIRKVAVPCSKSSVRVKKEDQIIVPGMHEAIVTVEEYEAAQKVVKKTGRTRAAGQEYPLKSLVFCGNCGRHMTRRRSKNVSRFQCTHGRYDSDSLCKKIRSPAEEELEKIVFGAVQAMIKLADDKRGRSGMLQARKREMSESRGESTAVLQGRVEKLKKEKLKAYEKYCTEELDQEAYIREKRKLDGEIAECEKAIQENREESRKLERSLPEVGSELEMAVSAYKEADHLTSDMARAFIEKIVICQEEQIEIQWRFSDCFLNEEDEERPYMGGKTDECGCV